MVGHWLDEIEQMHNEMERLSRFMLGHPLVEYEKGKPVARGFRMPIVNQFETKEKLITEIELPGVEKKDIELNIGDNFAEVKVVRMMNKENHDQGIHRFESKCASFYRRIPFPIEVKTEMAHAIFKNGILKLELPKAKALETVNTKKLEIE
jgi:HSP20 family protein